MSFYLNRGNEDFLKAVQGDIYIDKSQLMKKTNSVMNTDDCYMCLARPRGYGKSVALSMLNAYYSKGCDSRELFKNLKIGDDPSFEKNLNKHDVIWVDMKGLYDSLLDKKEFIRKFQEGVYSLLKENFPEAHLDIKPDDTCFLMHALYKVCSTRKEGFVFLIDDWDILFRKQKENKALCRRYMEILYCLFSVNDSCYWSDLVYLTGIFPMGRPEWINGIVNFSDSSATMAFRKDDFIGFTESEMKSLCERYKRDYQEFESQYGGYTLDEVGAIYNPTSVIPALISGECASYWSKEVSIETLAKYMNFDNGALKGKFYSLLSGERINQSSWGFSRAYSDIKCNGALFATLVYLGYLGYHEDRRHSYRDECSVPNKEMASLLVKAAKALGWDDVPTLMLSPDWKGRS